MIEHSSTWNWNISNKIKRSLTGRIKDSYNTWVKNQFTIGSLTETYVECLEALFIDERSVMLSWELWYVNSA